MVMAQSLFIALKERFPSLVIDVLAPAWSKPILAAMPQVQQALELPVKHGELALFKRYQLAKRLHTQQYDWAIVLPRSLKSALIPYWAKIPLRTGYKGEMRYRLLNDMRPLDKHVLSMTVQRFVALGLEPAATLPPRFAQPVLTVSPAAQQQVKAKFLPNSDKKLLALCPGAEYGEAKRWPADYYAAVAKFWLAQGGQVVLVGSAKEAAVTTTISTLVPSVDCLDLAGQTSLEEVMLLLSLAKQVVSNDSGLMHIAAAVNTPVIAVYGSSDPRYTPPLNPHAQIVYLGLECSPCFKRECPLRHLNCLNQLLPEQIIARLTF